MKRRAMFVLKLLVSGVLVWLLVRTVPLAAVARSLGSAAPAATALGLALVPAYLWATAVQQSILLRGLGIGLRPAGVFALNLATGFYSLLLPGVLAGGAYRWYRLTAGGQHRVEAVLFIVASRLMELTALVLIGLAGFAAARPSGIGVSVGALLAAAAVLLAAGIAVVLDARLVRRLRSRLPAEPAGRAAATASRALDALIALAALPRGELLRMCAWLGVRHLLEIASFLALAHAVGIALPALAGAWVRSFIALAVMLPVSIAGVGVREAGLVVTLGGYGVAAEAALALAVLLLARTLLVALAGGAVEAVRVLGGRAPGEAAATAAVTADG